MLKEEEVEFEFAKIKIYKERKEKDRFINSINTLLISVMIDKYKTDYPSNEKITGKESIGVMIGKYKKAELFEKMGCKYFNKGFLNVIAWLRNEHVKGRINTLEKGEEGFELNEKEMDIIYYSLKNILKELGYEVNTTPEICEICSEKTATVKLGKKSCCELCKLKLDSFKEYMAELDSRNKKLIRELREKLSDNLQNPALIQVEKEKQQKVYTFLFDKINQWYSCENSSEPAYSDEVGKLFVNFFYEYLEERLKEQKYESDDSRIRVDFDKLAEMYKISDEEIKAINEEIKNRFSIKNEENLRLLLSKQEDYDKEFLDSIWPNFKYEYKDKNLVRDRLKLGGILEMINVLLDSAKDGWDKDGMQGFIDYAEEQLFNLINPSLEDNEEEYRDFITNLITLLQD
jgi:hypothetical protein